MFIFVSQGHEVKLVTFADATHLVMLLPGKTAGEFRIKCAEYMARMCSGDRSLIKQIEDQYAATTPEQREVMMQGVPTLVITGVEKRCREENMLLDLEERRANLEQRKAKVQEMNFDFQVKRMKLIGELVPLDDRDRLYFKDLLKMSCKPGYSMITDSPDEVRGREISIALVAQEMGVNVSGKGPTIGKLMAQKWKDAHPNEEPVKRDTLYQGRPYKENTYFQCDYDMLKQCIIKVLGQ